MISPTLHAITLWEKFKNLIKNEENFQSMVEDIRDENDLYCFYSSRVLLHIAPKKREAILSELLIKFPRPEHQWRVDYLKMAFTKQTLYYNQAIDAIEKVSAEDLIYFLEYKLQFMLKNSVAFDGKKSSPEVIDSQYQHLTSTFNEIIKFISIQNIPFSGHSSISHTKNCEKIIFSLSYFLIIKEQIKEVLNFSYEVIPSKLIPAEYFGKLSEKVDFLLTRKTSNWGSLEIYRDLNYAYLNRVEESEQEILAIMKSIGLVRSNRKGDVLQFDFSKEKKFDTEIRFHKVEKLIAEIYESTEREFYFKNKKFTISNLVDIAKKIYTFSEKIDINEQQTSVKRKIYRYGEKQLWRILDFNKQLQILFELFTYDFDSDFQSKSTSLPILRKNNIYYISSSHISNQSYEKVIDKILSRNDISVILLEKEKGLSFESKLQSNIRNAGFQVGKIKRDEKKGVPEIDGIFSLSDKDIIVYEAKCTIKPEERDDAYGFVENHLSKACDQLLIRLEFLKNFPREAEERIKFPIENKKITCLVITNHSYFTGLTISSENGDLIHIIDQNLLLHILSKNTMPSWSINLQSGTYFRQEVNLNNKDSIISAIKDPVKFLRSKAKGNVQISEYGAAYEISSSPCIDWSSLKHNSIK